MLDKCIVLKDMVLKDMVLKDMVLKDMVLKDMVLIKNMWGGDVNVNVNELQKLSASNLWNEITRLNTTNNTTTNKVEVNTFIDNFNTSYMNDLGGNIPFLKQ
jgi:hypothetical protein